MCVNFLNQCIHYVARLPTLQIVVRNVIVCNPQALVANALNCQPALERSIRQMLDRPFGKKSLDSRN